MSGPSGPSEPSGSSGTSGPTGIDQPPPFWGRWNRLYWLVVGLLAADVLVFWLLTRWAS
jgi:hypothetical protein